MFPQIKKMKTWQRFNLISSEVSCVSASCEPAEEQQLMKNLETLAAARCDSPCCRSVSADVGRIEAQIPDSLPPEPSFAVAFARGLIARDNLGFLLRSSFFFFFKNPVSFHFCFLHPQNKTINHPACLLLLHLILPRLRLKHIQTLGKSNIQLTLWLS